MGQPVAFFTVNGTKRHSRGPFPRPGETKTSAQFWTEFWTERLQALQRHLSVSPDRVFEILTSAAEFAS